MATMVSGWRNGKVCIAQLGVFPTPHDRSKQLQLDSVLVRGSSRRLIRQSRPGLRQGFRKQARNINNVFRYACEAPHGRLTVLADLFR